MQVPKIRIAAWAKTGDPPQTTSSVTAPATASLDISYLHTAGLPVMPSETHIVPVHVGLADGTVVIAKKETRPDRDDPVIGKFLEFLARDMAHELVRIRPVPRSLVSHAKALVKGVDVDASLPDDEA